MPELHTLASIPTKILLPIDFSPSSQTALEMAADLAQHFHAELFLVNIIPMFIATTIPDFMPEENFTRAASARAKNYLTKCQAVLEARGIKANFSIEIGNDIAGNIMDMVEREHADMVVISTHGISGWHPLVFGSIAEKVVKLVRCPLLLLRSKETEAGDNLSSKSAVEWWR